MFGRDAPFSRLRIRVRNLAVATYAEMIYKNSGACIEIDDCSGVRYFADFSSVGFRSQFGAFLGLTTLKSCDTTKKYVCGRKIYVCMYVCFKTVQIFMEVL